MGAQGARAVRRRAADDQQPHGADGRHQGLEALKRPCRVELHTDSIYVRDGITRWIHGWQRNGWRTSDKKPVKNAELWQELLDAAAPHRIDWHWVKGHSGHPENDRVDALACAAADDQRRQNAPLVLVHRLRSRTRTIFGGAKLTQIANESSACGVRQIPAE